MAGMIELGTVTKFPAVLTAMEAFRFKLLRIFLEGDHLVFVYG